MWWKKCKWKILVPVLLVAVLAFAFWYGGNAPGLRGWTVEPETSGQTIVSQDGSELSAGQSAGDALETTKTPEGSNTETTNPSGMADTQNATEPEGAEPSGELKEPDTSTAPETDSPTEPVMEIDPETGKDQYLTDPVPEGKPVPVEPQDVTIGTAAYTCTISISCATILDNLDYCNPEKVELVPEDGWILEPMTVTFYEGESVFNVLQRTCKQQGIHMEYEDTPIYNSAYIEGIHNLYEFDVGELSGWMYKVNNWFPNYGCSRYQLQAGDVIEWVYTCDLGVDVGGYYSTGS